MPLSTAARCCCAIHSSIHAIPALPHTLPKIPRASEGVKETTWASGEGNLAVTDGSSSHPAVPASVSLLSCRSNEHRPRVFDVHWLSCPCRTGGYPIALVALCSALSCSEVLGRSLLSGVFIQVPAAGRSGGAAGTYMPVSLRLSVY
ncbi:hypothetical protein CGRA01v4_02194 [Colletotrichum graminicola]|nr:hypothetical protein CGRA01v4_02194 [Colletotrichum graminicola]